MFVRWWRTRQQGLPAWWHRPLRDVHPTLGGPHARPAGLNKHEVIPSGAVVFGCYVWRWMAMPVMALFVSLPLMNYINSCTNGGGRKQVYSSTGFPEAKRPFVFCGGWCSH